MKTSKHLAMNEMDKATLVQIARNRNTPQKVALRARIAIMSADGVPTSQMPGDYNVKTKE